MGLCPICDKQAYLEALGDKGRILECPCGWKFAGLNASKEHSQHMDRCLATHEGRRYLARKRIGLFSRLFLTPRRLRVMESEGIRQLEGEWADRKKAGSQMP